MSIARMHITKNKLVVSIIGTLLMMMLIAFIPIKSYASENKLNVNDSANLLTDSQLNKLNKTLREYSDKYDIDIVVLTVAGLDGKSDRNYLEDYVDSVLDAGIYSENITILQFDTDSRYCTIQAYGSCERVINDDNIEYILDVVAPQISEHNYYDAFNDFAKGVNHYYDNPRYEFGHEPLYLKTWFQLVVALAIGGVVVGTMAYHSQGRNTVNNHTYLDEQRSGIVARRDIYLRTSVSKVRKPSNNNNSSGGGRSSGGGGISSGGRSHSGGSRRC